MSDEQRAIRNAFVGGALAALSLYMLVYVGSLKKVYTDWMMNPRHGTAVEERAASLWPRIVASHNEHPFLWEVAPFFPPYGWLNREVWFTWPFLKANWRFLAWLVLLGGSGVMFMTRLELKKLVDQLNHEDRLEMMRVKRHGGMTVPASGATLIDIRNEILVRAAETGKWWGLNGMIVGGAIATIIATMILKWLGAIH